MLPSGQLVSSNVWSGELRGSIFVWTFPERLLNNKEIQSILEALKENQSITTLNLSGLPLDEKSIQTLAELLTINKTPYR